MDDLTRFNNYVTSNDSDDGWDAVPASDSGMIRGKHVKFTTDGHYVISKSSEPTNGRETAVVGVLTMWIKWMGNKPDPRVTQRGYPHIFLSNLPDQVA